MSYEAMTFYNVKLRRKCLWKGVHNNAILDDNLVHFSLQSFANVIAKSSSLTRWGVNILISQTNSHPIVEQTAKEFMFGYESPLVTLGNQFMPSWIKFDKLGLIDRVSIDLAIFVFKSHATTLAHSMEENSIDFRRIIH